MSMRVPGRSTIYDPAGNPIKITNPDGFAGELTHNAFLTIRSTPSCKSAASLCFSTTVNANVRHPNRKVTIGTHQDKLTA